MSEAIRIDELKKELEKFGSLREKVLRLNEIDKFKSIYYGANYIEYNYYGLNSCGYTIVPGDGGCRFCHVYSSLHKVQIKLKIKNCNIIKYFTCPECKDKTLCTYCLHEKHKCNFRTKQKITFWLCFPKIPKDIRRLITNLFFKN